MFVNSFGKYSCEMLCMCQSMHMYNCAFFGSTLRHIEV